MLVGSASMLTDSCECDCDCEVCDEGVPSVAIRESAAADGGWRAGSTAIAAVAAAGRCCGAGGTECESVSAGDVDAALAGVAERAGVCWPVEAGGPEWPPAGPVPEPADNQTTKRQQMFSEQNQYTRSHLVRLAPWSHVALPCARSVAWLQLLLRALHTISTKHKQATTHQILHEGIARDLPGRTIACFDAAIASSRTSTV